jgi:hypothetical protein
MAAPASDLPLAQVTVGETKDEAAASAGGASGAKPEEEEGACVRGGGACVCARRAGKGWALSVLMGGV